MFLVKGCYLFYLSYNKRVKVIIRIALMLLIFLIGIRLIERRSIYFPLANLTNNPSDIGLNYRSVYFHTSDQKKLKAWFIPREGAEFTVLFSNGNAGNISYRLEKIALLHQLGLNVFIYDYRGYGKSQGSPSEEGLYKDIRGAYDYLLNQLGVSQDEIILYGESLGGAVAIDLASQKPVRAIIVEGTFSSVKEMARRVLPFVPHFILASRFDNLAKISGIECEKMIIHSKDDEIIPFSQAKRLFEAAKAPKKFLKLRGGHNTAFWDSIQKYKEGLRSFLSQL